MGKKVGSYSLPVSGWALDFVTDRLPHNLDAGGMRINSI
jgi:hypothetical protein